MNNTMENAPNPLSDLLATNPFVSAAALEAAIKVVKAALAAPAESESRQEILETVYNHIDQLLVRDFSGEVAASPEDIVLICKNAFEPWDMAVELHSQNGDVCFYYLPAEAALRFLETALATIDRQVVAVTEKAPAPVKKSKTARKYKSIYKVVVEAFDQQVVQMLGYVEDKKLSLQTATAEGQVFASPITDALFFAWSCNYKHPAIAEGCIYDYLASGDSNLLSNN